MSAPLIVGAGMILAGLMLALDVWRIKRDARRERQERASIDTHETQMQAAFRAAWDRHCDRVDRRTRRMEAVEAAKQRPRGWPDVVLLNMPCDEWYDTLPKRLADEGAAILERENGRSA